ncbi:class I SAM-dependent DNA methyltransferase [Alkaliphilus transvaalensis]|uniref:class I SAM-dependent DNA methyltransferase n=1 Tax=Alkaliphilus transvaalensis TaxID=114628 RepID=UPI00047C58CC|nr:class I SAM-dependent methyltransferase [Alkaliphilus transvaalensis]
MAYKELSNIYDGYWLIFSRLYKKFIKSVQLKHNIKMDTILDIGCGTGSLANMLSNGKNIITGLDLSEDMLEKARQKSFHDNNLEFIQGSFTNFNLNKKYDLVLSCHDSLNHISKLEELDLVFKCVKEHLIDKGFFIFDIVNEKFFLNIIKERNEINDYSQEEYINELTYDEGKKVFKSSFVFQDSKDEHEEIPIEYNEIIKHIEKYNFEIVDVFSDFYLNGIVDNAERLFFVLQNK